MRNIEIMVDYKLTRSSISFLFCMGMPGNNHSPLFPLHMHKGLQQTSEGSEYKPYYI